MSASPPERDHMEARRSSGTFYLDRGFVLSLFGLLGFSVWCVFVVQQSSVLQEDVAARSLWLRDLQTIQKDLHSNPAESPEISRAFDSLQTLADTVETQSGLQRETFEVRHRLSVLRSVLHDTSSRTRARVDLVRAIDSLAVGLWAELETIANALHTQLLSLIELAAIAILLAVVAVILVIVARRRRRAADSLRLQLEAALVSAETAQRLAVEASQAKSRFVATVSHEIRTPMTSILGTLELLATKGLTDHQDEHYRVIQSSGEGLLALINDVLDLSRIEYGQLNLDPEEFSLSDLMDEVLLLFAGPASSKGLHLSLIEGKDVPSVVVGDPRRLRQVLVNLVGNAVKFTDRGEIQVRVDAPAGGKLRFVVADTGHGIPEESTGLIFDAFTQLDASSTRSHGGTGLGLTIAQRLVTAMGGTLDVVSVEGQGTSLDFSVEFECRSVRMPENPGGPLLLVGDTHALTVMREQLSHWSIPYQWAISWEAAESARLKASDHGRVVLSADVSLPDDELGVPTVKLTSLGYEGDLRADTMSLVLPMRPNLVMRILQWEFRSESVLEPPAAVEALGLRKVMVVDDNVTNRKVIGQLLEFLGCDVQGAEGGEAAMRFAAGTCYDLILMDCDMPIMDGLETTRNLRASNTPNRDTIIVGLSGHAVDSARAEGLASGMDDYLPKPVRLALLKTLLERVPPGTRSAGRPQP